MVGEFTRNATPTVTPLERRWDVALLQEALHESRDDGIPGTSLAITSHRAAKEPLQWETTESNTIRAECLKSFID